MLLQYFFVFLLAHGPYRAAARRRLPPHPRRRRRRRRRARRLSADPRNGAADRRPDPPRGSRPGGRLVAMSPAVRGPGSSRGTVGGGGAAQRPSE